jgi:penicillin-binding protein 1B
MTRKSTAKKKQTGKNSRSGYFKYIQILVILFCLVTAGILWLDYTILTAFEGRRWLLPARVYATPIEIYTGQTLLRERLIQQLKDSGYSENESLDVPGNFRRAGRNLEFFRRNFTYWDGIEQAEKIHISFNNNQITGISTLSGGLPIDPVRIEPQLIGKIYPLHNEDRVIIPPDKIPIQLINALIATEDRNFYNHHGMDFRGMLRALYINFKERNISQGGSTLTQQLVKNYFLSSARTLQRKFSELIMAVLLELHYSKEEILAAYINEIFLGQSGNRSIHGFGTAAEFYYSRPVDELGLEQLAMLVGLVRGASYYNPRQHPHRVQERRNMVLGLMYEQGYISKAQLQMARSLPLDISAKPGWNIARHPAFLGLVKSQLLQVYNIEDLRNEGLRIFTTLEPDIQNQAEQSATRRLELLEKTHQMKPDSLQLAAVIVRYGTGEVQAVIGDRNMDIGSFNRASDAIRPIGSLIKPAIYLTALSMPDRYGLSSRVNDKPVAIRLDNDEIWSPENYDQRFHGQITLVEALQNSYNAATVNLGMEIGLDAVINTLQKLGIRKTINRYPSLLLGAIELAPIDVAQMYQTIANGGYQISLNTIREVLDSTSQPLQRKNLEMRQIMDPEPVFLLDFMLEKVVQRGTAQELQKLMPERMPLAGKTGTTNDLRDSWFAGFGDNLLGVIWIGRDDNNPAGLTGASGAMMVWGAMMDAIGIKPLNPIAPSGIRWLHAPRSSCTELNSVPYIEGNLNTLQQACSH